MSDLSYRLTEIRSQLVPIGQFVAWPIFFLLASAISEQPAYFLALVLVLAADLFDSSPRKRGLFRDLIAGGTTAILSSVMGSQLGLAVGAAVAVTAVSRLYQKR
jgi:hypothetical protein